MGVRCSRSFSSVLLNAVWFAHNSVSILKRGSHSFVLQVSLVYFLFSFYFMLFRPYGDKLAVSLGLLGCFTDISASRLFI